MSHTDTNYYRSRADEERAAAGQASDDRAAEAHRELARQYDEMADRDEPADPAAN